MKFFNAGLALVAALVLGGCSGGLQDSSMDGLSGAASRSTSTGSLTVTGTNGSITVSAMSGTSLTVSYAAGSQLTFCRLFLSQGNGTGLVLASKDMDYSSGTYSYTYSHSSFTSGATIYVCVLTNTSGTEKCVPQGTLATTTSWASFTYGSSDPSSSSSSTSSSTTSSSATVSGTNGSLSVSAMSGTSLTVSYAAGSQLTFCRLFLSQGNGTGLVLASKDMDYSSGTYSYTYSHSSFTSGATIYVCVLTNTSGTEKCVPQGTLAMATSWASFTYASTGSSSSSSSSATTTDASSIKSSLSLAWSDEFAGSSTTPDATLWTYDTTDTVGGGWGNNELETYTSSRTNSYVSNGTLKIVAVKDSSGNWTSGRLKTKGLKDFTYGYIEVKAKLAVAAGTWPAIWMLPTDNAYGIWPASGEIDIMEHATNTWGLGHVAGTVHSTSDGSTGTSLGSTTYSDAGTAFHTYAVYWTASKIALYYDDVKLGEYANAGTGYTTWPFDKNFHMILNIAVGGTLGGTVSSSLSSDTMEIEYVRVYQ